jgi:putative acetyltransferase
MIARTAAQLTVRDATDDDSYDVIGLVASCWSEYEGCVLDVDGEMPHLRAIASAYAGWGGRLWVVEDGARLVATAGVVPGASPEPSPRPSADPLPKGEGTLAAPEEAELRMLYVHRRWRKRGLGARLVELVETEAASRGAREVFLWSDTRFEAAHRLYERLGYARAAATRELHDLSGTVEFGYRKHLQRVGL